jgi:hypothetical protein
MENAGPTRRVFLLPSPHKARKEIIKFIADSGVGFTGFYIGTASDPDTRLFVHHHVDKNSLWTYQDAGQEEAARTIAKFIIDTYQAKGDADKGDGTARYVYAFAVTGTTKNPPP